MTELVLELAVVLFVAKAGGLLAKRLKLPQVLGELGSGILIGPFLLGSIALPGFPEGLFPLKELTSPVGPELYGFATVASLILLFLAGLETDLDLFLKYSLKGTVVGVGGVIASFALAVLTGVWWLHLAPMAPQNLFLGVLSIATSVGITARLLSDKRKMDSPEGVTILSAAVIDDVLGIIVLAVVLGLTTLGTTSEAGIDWGAIGWIALRAFGVWLGVSAVGLLSAKKLAHWMKKFPRPSDFVVLALGITFLISGLFEQAGLAMIVGAYVTGLSLSKTDIALILQEKMQVLHDLLVPIFFAVMGMLVDLRVFLDPQVLLFGGIFTLGAIAAKIVGAGLPSLFLGFNPLGALRIGLGMVPRGEVALIIAGIGFSTGILDRSLFGVSVLMTLLTTVAAPPLLNWILGIPKRGTHKEIQGSESVETVYEFASSELTEMVANKLVTTLETEGFFLHALELEGRLYRAGKEDVFFSLLVQDCRLTFNSQAEDQLFLQTMVYESLMNLGETVSSLQTSFKPERMVRGFRQERARTTVDLSAWLPLERIVLDIKPQSKESLLKELCRLAARGAGFFEEGQVLEDLQEREHSMSTGLAHGIAVPHAKTEGVDRPRLALALCQEGTDFQALDGEPSRIFWVILSPKKGPSSHLQILSSISALLKNEENRRDLLNCRSRADVLAWIRQASRKT